MQGTHAVQWLLLLGVLGGGGAEGAEGILNTMHDVETIKKTQVRLFMQGAKWCCLRCTSRELRGATAGVGAGLVDGSS